jgi:hypothetical protein
VGAASGVVLGYGSIGRVHAKILADRYGRIAVVDVAPAALSRAATDLDGAVLGSSVDELDRLRWDWSSTLAVIATWGPSHARDFDALRARGVRKVICEKPLASSVHAAHQMVEAAGAQGIALGVHMQRRYSGLVGAIQRLEAEHALGPPVALVVHGGAKCMVTNGIHFVDLGAQIFGAPRSVVARLDGEPINPRSPTLLFFGGTAVWSFADGREAAVTFLNGSAVSPTVLVYYRDAVLDLSAEPDAVLRARRSDDVRRWAAVTRTSAASETIFAETLPGVVAGAEPTIRLIEEVERGSVVTFPPPLAVEALGACVGALAAARDGVSVPLPIDPGSEIGLTEWPIS